ncbi:MAG: cupredoxin domain-containing protein [Halioglobus sp.]
MIITNILGLLLIALIVWWFWLYKPEAVASDGAQIIIKVADGIYEPAQISLPAGVQTSIGFLRTDESPCSAVVVFPDLDISEDLPVGTLKEVLIPELESGEYPFTCQMQMYRGNLVVRDS